jgi:DNA-directed RNA polymerase omega subunit
MARVTVEDCLARVSNRFALTILASRRARALSEGRGRALVECDNKEGVTALREISSAKVRFREEVEPTMMEFIEEQRRQLRVTTGEHTFLEAASLRALEDEDEGDDLEEPEIEELQSDPEALGKQAKGTAEDDEEVEDEVVEDEAVEDETPEDETETPTDDLDPAAFADEDVPDDADGDDEPVEEEEEV